MEELRDAQLEDAFCKRICKDLEAGSKSPYTEDERGFLVRSWPEYAGLLAYAYNTQVHPSIRVAPFQLVLSRPPGPMTLKGELVGGEAKYPRKVKDQFTQAVRKYV